MDSPEAWRWIWTMATVFFLVGELATAGTFFMLPFAVGAALAALLAFLGVGVAWEWAAFLLGTLGSFAAFIPLRHRLDRALPGSGTGANRLIGQDGLVVRALRSGDTGLVRVGREEWTAECADGSALEVGTVVRVTEVRGTRAIVSAVPAPGADGGPGRTTLKPWEMP